MLLASPRLAHLQSALDVLKELFDRLGFYTNVNKTAGMVFQTYLMAVGHSEEAYQRQGTGVGPSSQDRQRERARCPDCIEELAEGSLVLHHQSQHETSRGPQ